MNRKKSYRPTNRNRQWKPLFEAIESRTLLSATPSGLTPLEVRQAYNFNQITFTNSSGQSIVGDGAGQTIAIVDPYNATTIDNDLDTFDKTFSFDNSGQNIYQEFGAANTFLSTDLLGRGESNAGWALEVALDVEWAHAIAPAAKIDLVEAVSASTNDLLAAVKTAADLPGVSVVSMSWGGNEARNETSLDSAFTTPQGHSGVTFVAASGDNGRGAEWPAVSPNVVSVGGTTLSVSSNGTYQSESAWSDSGGGLSSVESEPTYQDSVNNTGLRSTPDVAYDANPNTGFSVYTSVKQGKQSGWFTVGGTSAGAPQWSALIAIANQGRFIAGETNLDGVSQTLPYLYEMSSSSFHDITTGSNGYRATTGYDLATGLGTPIANAVVSNLISPGSSTSSGSAAGSGSGSGSGSNSAPPSHYFPFPFRFHMPVGRFPNRFHRWDVIASEPVAAVSVQSTSAFVVHSVPATHARSTSTSGIQPGAASTNSTGIFGSTLFAESHELASPSPNTIALSNLTNLDFPIQTSTFSTQQHFSSSENSSFAHSTIAQPVPSANSFATLAAIQSESSHLATMLSSTLITINEDGLQASLLVLPIIAFWAYQSRLSKTRQIHSLHWIQMP